MRIITLNVNGIRSAARKGVARWLARVEPWDVVCLQEIKCAHDDVPPPMRAPRKSTATFHPAVRKGYSGVAIGILSVWPSTCSSLMFAWPCSTAATWSSSVLERA